MSAQLVKSRRGGLCIGELVKCPETWARAHMQAGLGVRCMRHVWPCKDQRCCTLKLEPAMSNSRHMIESQSDQSNSMVFVELRSCTTAACGAASIYPWSMTPGGASTRGSYSEPHHHHAFSCGSQDTAKWAKKLGSSGSRNTTAEPIYWCPPYSLVIRESRPDRNMRAGARSASEPAAHCEAWQCRLY